MNDGFVTEPKIALVGQTIMNPNGVLAFLDDHGLEWPALRKKLDSMVDLGDNDCEWLVEMAGRTCYMSFSGRGRDHSDHIKHLIEVGHGCYDIETEVLTIDGWKRWPNVTGNDLLATRNTDGAVEYHKPRRLISSTHKGKMYRVEGRGVDLLVTPNHKMLVCKTTTKDGRKRENFELIRADKLGHTSHAYIKNASITFATGPRIPLSPTWFKLLGFAMGDGYIGPRSKQIKFHLRKERKILFLQRLCESLKLDLSMNGDRFAVGIPVSVFDLMFSMYDENGEKQIEQSILGRASYDQLMGLYVGLMESDGSYMPTQHSFCTTSKTLANQFQQICLHIGLAANMSVDYERESCFGDKPLFSLGVIRRELKPEVNRYKDCVGKTSWIENWEGEIFCAEVPNNTLYVRRNGKPVWCGNSVLEHVQFNFEVWQISRSCSHEIIRHRAGFAYSQLSQRYVDSSSVRFIIPPGIQELQKSNPLAYRKWLAHCEMSRQLYEQLTTDLAELYQDLPQATERRKKARQAARSVLPNATETKMLMSANGRAVRHFIEMRASAAADLEIRVLAVKMFKLMEKNFPLIVYGMSLVVLPDGTEAVESKFRKV